LFHSRLYIHATEVGGTHPALVEAMGAGRPVVYYDTPENREVAGDAGERFRFEGDSSLNRVLGRLLDDDAELENMGRRSRRRVDGGYLWSDVADAYENLLEGLC
jgi:glycosyltransferase involved in cell wall biosynthesis